MAGAGISPGIIPQGVRPQLMGGRWVGASVPCGVFNIRVRPRLGTVAPDCAPPKGQDQPARILGASESCSQYGGMNKTIYTRQAECLRETIVEMRRKAGLSQRQLAERLGRERNLVGRLEVGQRRLDVVEFYSICKACDADLNNVFQCLLQKFEEIQTVA